MELLTNETILTYLKSKNIDTTNLNDPLITEYYNTYLNYILTQTGLSLEPETKTINDVLINKFKNKNYLLYDYPIDELISVQVDDKEITPTEYYLDKTNGILRWKTIPIGEELQITYTTILEPETISLITATLLDLIYYNLDTNPTKNITSLKEGDVSISYDTNNSTSTNIKNNLDKLKEISNYKPLGKMIR